MILRSFTSRVPEAGDCKGDHLAQVQRRKDSDFRSPPAKGFGLTHAPVMFTPGALSPFVGNKRSRPWQLLYCLLFSVISCAVAMEVHDTPLVLAVSSPSLKASLRKWNVWESLSRVAPARCSGEASVTWSRGAALSSQATFLSASHARA